MQQRQDDLSEEPFPDAGSKLADEYANDRGSNDSTSRFKAWLANTPLSPTYMPHKRLALLRAKNPFWPPPPPSRFAPIPHVRGGPQDQCSSCGDSPCLRGGFCRQGTGRGNGHAIEGNGECKLDIPPRRSFRRLSVTDMTAQPANGIDLSALNNTSRPATVMAFSFSGGQARSLPNFDDLYDPAPRPGRSLNSRYNQLYAGKGQDADCVNPDCNAVLRTDMHMGSRDQMICTFCLTRRYHPRFNNNIDDDPFCLEDKFDALPDLVITKFFPNLLGNMEYLVELHGMVWHSWSTQNVWNFKMGIINEATTAET